LIPRKVLKVSSRACIEFSCVLFQELTVFPQTSHPCSEPLLPPHNFHSLRRLPQCPTRCQPIHISHPMPITLGISMASGPQPLPSIPPHRPQAGFHTLPHQLPYTNNQASAVRHRLSPCTGMSVNVSVVLKY